ncbi:MAG: DUF1552 domain-containing protein [Gemmataceae bacterium]|nr:DUF1552 domain-containing protein [Gemmataceae bacterium]
MALPLLEAMLPRTALAAQASQAALPRRMAFLYVPNGVIQADWTPSVLGTDYNFRSILKPMLPHKQDLLILSGLTCDKARPNGDGPGDHARASASFLTGAQARKTAGANIRAGVSADQIGAQRLGDRTRLPSLEIAVERFRGTGNCDSGYSCVYEHTLAWRDATSPLPTESDPRLIFNRLFSAQPNDPARIRRDQDRASVLDAVLDDARALENQLGGTDRQRLDQYLSNVRELEQRIQRAEKLPPVQIPEDAERVRRLPADLTEHFRLVCDVVALAFQTDVTRIITLMVAREGSNLQYRMIGVTGGHHELTHHRNDPRMIDSVRAINTYHVRQFAYLVEKLKSIREGEGTLLDQCMVAYGSAIGDGNRHTHHDLPILLAGKGGGTIRTGRHVRYPRETPVTNLWLAMLERFGTRVATLGDSTGVLTGL